MENETILYSIPEICEMLSISRSTAYRLIRTGKITTISIGRLTRVTRTEIEAFIERASGGNA